MNRYSGMIKEFKKMLSYHEQEVMKLKNAIDYIENFSEKKIIQEPQDETHKRIDTGRVKKKTRPIPNQSGKRRGPRGKFSKYKGVYKGKSKKPFTAAAWIGGKNKCLGDFDNELEAAATAAKARGEMELAQQLFDQAEQEENNLDRPKSTRGPQKRLGKSHVDAQKKITDEAKTVPATNPGETPSLKVFTCKHCHIEQKADKQPFQCVHCHSGDFDKRELRDGD